MSINEETDIRDHYADMAQRNFFDELITLRDNQRSLGEVAEVLLDGDKIPWEMTPHGEIKWYMAPTMDDLAISTYVMYLLRIPPGSRSGKQLVPGDQLVFVWEGEVGYSEIDGATHEWGRWDLVQVPVRTQGCTVQHFNTGSSDAKLLVTQLNSMHSFGVDRHSGFEQLDPCPEFSDQ